MTHFHEFKRDDGSTVSVEYSFKYGSPTTYNPISGADGGDGDEVDFVKVFSDAGDVELTDAENERAFQEIMELDHDYDDDIEYDCR